MRNIYFSLEAVPSEMVAHVPRRISCFVICKKEDICLHHTSRGDPYPSLSGIISRVPSFSRKQISYRLHAYHMFPDANLTLLSWELIPLLEVSISQLP